MEKHKEVYLKNNKAEHHKAEYCWVDTTVLNILGDYMKAWQGRIQK